MPLFSLLDKGDGSVSVNSAEHANEINVYFPIDVLRPTC